MCASYQKFAKIIESKNLSSYRVAKDTGLTTVLFTDWKKGKSKPKYGKMKIIADYLGVDVEYLTGDQDEPCSTDNECVTNAKGTCFVDIFTQLCEEKKLSPNAVCRELGLSNSIYTYWKKNRTLPNNFTLNAIALYFGVSVEYLTGYVDDPKMTVDIPSLDTIPVGKRGMRPVYGRVGAGEGTFAEDHIVGWESVDAKYDTEEYFYLRVQGSSMSPKIEDGDLVLVKKQSALDNGNIGVFLVDGTDGLIKKIEYDQTHISLISFNSVYQPMVFVNEDMTRVAVIGKVVELKRVF